ncbi:hypothetical protein AWB71_05991 [Caballeronia peredens]|nr:hypothetical protein AWB71_05991 [Caballeronia peredens]
MALTFELYPVAVKDKEDVVDMFGTEKTRPDTLWDQMEEHASYRNKGYIGLIKDNGKVLYGGKTNDSELTKETLDEILRSAIALRNNTTPDDVMLNSNVKVVLKDEGREDVVLHNYDYFQYKKFETQVESNVLKYAELSSSHPALSNDALVKALTDNEAMDESKPRDFYRFSVPRLGVQPNSKESEELRRQAMQKMKEAHSLDLKLASPATRREVEAKHVLERRLFTFNMFEDKAGRLGDTLDPSSLSDDSNDFRKVLNDSFKDYAAAKLGKDWRHTFKNGDTQPKIKAVMVEVPAEKVDASFVIASRQEQEAVEEKLPKTVHIPEASRQMLERQDAKRREQEAAERIKEEVARKAEEAARISAAEKAAQLERQSKFTVEHMQGLFDSNAKLDPNQPRDFLEHTRNNYTRMDFLSGNSGLTTGEYIRKYAGENDDIMAKEQVAKAVDNAYRELRESHKYQLHNTRYEDRPRIEAMQRLESAYLDFNAAIVEGRPSDISSVMPHFEKYQELNLGFAKEAVQTAQQDSFTQATGQQLRNVPKSFAPVEIAAPKNVQEVAKEADVDEKIAQRLKSIKSTKEPVLDKDTVMKNMKAMTLKLK